MFSRCRRRWISVFACLCLIFSAGCIGVTMKLRKLPDVDLARTPLARLINICEELSGSVTGTFAVNSMQFDAGKEKARISIEQDTDFKVRFNIPSSAFSAETIFLSDVTASLEFSRPVKLYINEKLVLETRKVSMQDDKASITFDLARTLLSTVGNLLCAEKPGDSWILAVVNVNTMNCKLKAGSQVRLSPDEEIWFGEGSRITFENLKFTIDSKSERYSYEGELLVDVTVPLRSTVRVGEATVAIEDGGINAYLHVNGSSRGNFVLRVKPPSRITGKGVIFSEPKADGREVCLSVLDGEIGGFRLERDIRRRTSIFGDLDAVVSQGVLFRHGEHSSMAAQLDSPTRIRATIAQSDSGIHQFAVGNATPFKCKSILVDGEDKDESFTLEMPAVTLPAFVYSTAGDSRLQLGSGLDIKASRYVRRAPLTHLTLNASTPAELRLGAVWTIKTSRGSRIVMPKAELAFKDSAFEVLIDKNGPEFRRLLIEHATGAFALSGIHPGSLVGTGSAEANGAAEFADLAPSKFMFRVKDFQYSNLRGRHVLTLVDGMMGVELKQLPNLINGRSLDIRDGALNFNFPGLIRDNKSERAKITLSDVSILPGFLNCSATLSLTSHFVFRRPFDKDNSVGYIALTGDVGFVFNELSLTEGAIKDIEISFKPGLGRLAIRDQVVRPPNSNFSKAFESFETLHQGMLSGFLPDINPMKFKLTELDSLPTWVKTARIIGPHYIAIQQGTDWLGGFGFREFQTEW